MASIAVPTTTQLRSLERKRQTNDEKTDFTGYDESSQNIVILARLEKVLFSYIVKIAAPRSEDRYEGRNHHRARLDR